MATAQRALNPVTASPFTPDIASDTPVVACTEPTSFAEDRYQVKRFLGESGKKKVYLVHDTTLDREVAFAGRGFPF